MGANLSKTSLLVKLLKKTYRKYRGPERWFDDIYKNSLARGTIKSSSSKAAAAFGYSFLGRITEIVYGAGGDLEILNNSKAVKWVLNFYNKRKENLLNYLIRAKKRLICSAGNWGTQAKASINLKKAK